MSPGGAKHGHLIEPKRHVQSVIEASGVPFMLHDLTRTFITVAEILDLSNYAIKHLVNHKLSNDVKAGHVVANVGRLREPMQRIADRLLEFAEMENRVLSFAAVAQARLRPSVVTTPASSYYNGLTRIKLWSRGRNDQ